MVDHLCSICQEAVKHTKVCGCCCNKWDLNEPWAKAAIEMEMQRRNVRRRDERFGVGEADPTGEKSFEEVLDSSKAAEDLLNQSELVSSEREFWQWGVDAVFDWAAKGGLSKSEFDALALLELDLSSEEAAAKLSEREGKPLTAAAYRRRVATARKKIRRAFNSPF